MDSDRSDLPEWPRVVGAVLPHGVRFEDHCIVDEVAGFSAPLDQVTAGLLGALESGVELGPFLQRNPGAWSALVELNHAHMLNVQARGWRVPAARACHRIALGERGALSAPVTLTRALWHLLRTPAALVVLLALASTSVVLASLSAPIEVLLVLPHTFLAYWLHELGHAVSAAAMAAPAYVLVDRHGLSVWARLAERPVAARVFAAAGPGVAILAGLVVLALLEAHGSRHARLQAFPYLVHLVALIPPAQDGRVLWFGPSQRSEEVST